jgi:Zn-dependent M32 family carboxypeptidase
MSVNEQTKLNAFLELKDYIDQTYQNLVELYKPGLSKEQIEELAYESRANLEDLKEELQVCIKQINKSFKINNAKYKAFRAAEDSPISTEEAEPAPVAAVSS